MGAIAGSNSAERLRPYKGAGERRLQGFTIVELVAVLLLLGVLSTFAMSRVMSGSSYSPAFVAQEVVAMTRFAQGVAMSRRDAAVTVELDVVGGDWRFRVLADDGAIVRSLREQRTETKDAAISVTSGADTIALGGGNAFVVAFDGLGNVVSAVSGVTSLDPSLGLAFLVTGAATFEVCVGPTGHAYRNVCT